MSLLLIGGFAAASRIPSAGTAALDGAFHGIAADATGGLGAARAKGYLVAMQAAVRNVDGFGAVFERPRDHLKSLLERDSALRHPPGAFHFGGHYPQVGGAVIATTAFL